METIHLKINAKVYDHVMWLLQQFDTNDVEIVSDKFYRDKAELDETLRLMDAGEMKYYTLDEFKNETDEIIKKYED
ncbi:hypothetical protein [Flavobacterium subsaxonicum]|uniref:Uncharacterized protein n=1 Tax=Flavobacterium subsaxonicum WB 4.1-42 = DSM 21790 TaxID=1121898 RepID=A0A0A2MI76_9FLAO|nr:hypothetical protein [Flavobacterium subsaxonicum]KGO92342.1 hypothetical protein Q766_12800 [Flavobacterium subsaxonicum WB 4.1-42 = DSM 21790]